MKKIIIVLILLISILTLSFSNNRVKTYINYTLGFKFNYPKETASLVTWLLYAAYLHTRFLNQWRGARSAILLVIGFCAVLFTFFGNYIFQGLHSYL